jgi:hypothetical protein
MSIFGRLPDNVLIDYPTGKWGFVGHVDVRLCWVMEDGSFVPPDVCQRIVESCYPAMVRKAHGVKTRAFDTREEAVAFAAELGLAAN